MNHLRIILDKSVVFGLRNIEVDTLDRYFFQIVPLILVNEILADLTKEGDNPDISNKIALHSYRISGNRGLTVFFHDIFMNSLLGIEIPMQGKYLPAGESVVRSDDGSVGMKIETGLEDETISRWERKEFTEDEIVWARNYRKMIEKPIDVARYLETITQAGLTFSVPNTDAELVDLVDSLLEERSLQSRLFVLIAKEFLIPYAVQDKCTLRWFKEGRPLMKDFAPYAFFCLRANFLWALGLTNNRLFKADINDRKDLQYCYYLPHTEIFCSGDDKHIRLVPALLQPWQRFISRDDLKKDLRTQGEYWEALSREERIQMRKDRGCAPPPIDHSLVFQLWKELRGKLSPPITNNFVHAGTDKEQPLGEFLQAKLKSLRPAERVSAAEFRDLSNLHGPGDSSSFVFRTRKVSKKRLLEMWPELNEDDLAESD